MNPTTLPPLGRAPQDIIRENSIRSTRSQKSWSSLLFSNKSTKSVNAEDDQAEIENSQIDLLKNTISIEKLNEASRLFPQQESMRSAFSTQSSQRHKTHNQGHNEDNENKTLKGSTRKLSLSKIGDVSKDSRDSSHKVKITRRDSDLSDSSYEDVYVEESEKDTEFDVEEKNLDNVSLGDNKTALIKPFYNSQSNFSKDTKLEEGLLRKKKMRIMFLAGFITFVTIGSFSIIFFVVGMKFERDHYELEKQSMQERITTTPSVSDTLPPTARNDHLVRAPSPSFTLVDELEPNKSERAHTKRTNHPTAFRVSSNLDVSKQPISDSSLSPTQFPSRRSFNPSDQSMLPSLQLKKGGMPQTKSWKMVSTISTPFVDQLDFTFTQYIIAVSTDCRKIAFGTPFVNGNTGAVTLFSYNNIISNVNFSSSGFRNSSEFDYTNKNNRNLNDVGNVKWMEVGTLTGENENDEFGTSISFSTEGNVFAVGAIKRNGDGYVKIYAESESSGIAFEEIGKIKSRGSPYISDNIARGQKTVGIEYNGEIGSLFGHSVSLSRDGKMVAVGEPWANPNGKPHSGRVEVFKKTKKSSDWKPIGRGLDGLQMNDWFGYAVSLDGNFLAVGAPKGSIVCVYRLNEEYDTWDMIGRELRGKHPKDLFGYQVSLSIDGRRLGVGAPLDPQMGENSGAAIVYELQNSYYRPIGQPLHGNERMCLFGSLMSISDDGNNVAIGGNLGLIYSYENADWERYSVEFDTTLDKVALALSMDGSKAVVVSQPGIAFIYSLDNALE